MTQDTKKLLTKEEIKTQLIDLLEEQIKMRRDLIQTMVGTLYPGIVRDEISYLRNLLDNVRDS